MKTTLAKIALLIQGKIIGESSSTVDALSTMDNILPNSLIFIDNKTYLSQAEQSTAAVILVDHSITHSSKPLICVDNPLTAFIKLLGYFYPQPKILPGIHSTAMIASDAIIGDNVMIGPYVIIESGCQIQHSCVIKGHNYIGKDVTIGSNTVLYPHVTLYDKCQLGNNITIHSGTILGADGFGYKFINGQHVKFPHHGHVIIEDHVEIGANTVIDRASMGATTIGLGTKIDNLVQIAHSVTIGKHNILCAFTGIAGSTTTGDRVICAANVGISDHVTVDDDVILGARTGVPPRKHLLKGLLYLGNPSRPKAKALENELSVTRIPFMQKTLKKLIEKIQILSNKITAIEKQSGSRKK